MKLEGLTVDFLGDSITEGVGVKDIENCRFDNRLKKACGFAKVNNYGIGGTRFAYQQKPSENPRFDLCMCGRLYNMDPSADLIVVYGGTNDYIHGDAHIGTPDDKTPETFYGAVEFLMTMIPERYPNAKVVFLTPAKFFYKDVPYTHVSNRLMKKADAMVLRGYVDIILQKGKEHGIPVFDMFEGLGLDPYLSPEQKATYYADGLHFNDEGHAVLAEKVKEFLENL